MEGILNKYVNVYFLCFVLYRLNIVNVLYIMEEQQLKWLLYQSDALHVNICKVLHM